MSFPSALFFARKSRGIFSLSFGLSLCLGIAGTAPRAYATPATTTTTLAVTASGSTVTTVASGTVATLTATVTSGATAVTPGQVNFCDGSPCTGIHLLGTAQLTSAGTAVLKLKPGIGSHSYQAVFVGTSSYGTSTSSPAALSVTGSYATTTTIAQSGSAGNYTLTATVAGLVNTHSTPLAPTGTVSFLDTTNSNYVLGTASLGAGTLAQGFAAQVSYSTGTSSTPDSVAVGDFNGDGIPDLAVANYGSSTVGIFLGNGGGTFRTQATYSTGSTSQPNSVAVGDFNGDGKPDLAVTSGTTNTLSIFLGNGDGTFQPQVTYSTGGTPTSGMGPTSVTVGDFNGDGIPDLAVANYGYGTVGIFQGNGDGTFQSQVTYSAGYSYPRSVAVGDFNGDGKLDLAVTIQPRSLVSVLLGNGDGTFQAEVSYSTGGTPISVAAGDFNGDGIVDLAVANLGDSTVSVLLGNGDGTFQTQVPYTTGSGPVSVAVGDFNGDGIADLAVASQSSNTVSVLLGKGDGTFQPQLPYATGSTPNSVAVGDFNGNGIPDLAVANNGSSTASVLLGQWTETATASASGISPVGPSGSHAVEVSYPGDSSFAASTSSTTSLTAQPAATTLTLSANPTSSTYGQQVVLTATLSPYTTQGYGTNGNTVTFSNNGTSLGTGTLSAGVAIFNVTSLPVGTDSLTAAYAGDSNFGSSSTATPVSFSVSQGTQTITFNNPGTQNFGTTPTLTATASSGLTVTFTSSTTSVCTVTSGGALTTLSAGTCTINADQAGNANYTPASTVTQSFAVAAVVPGAPTIGTATASVAAGGDQHATVTFTAPAFGGGAAITVYTATSSPGSLSGSCSSSPCTVTGLKASTTYTFTVTATNSAGTGAPSAASNTVTTSTPNLVVTTAADDMGTASNCTAQSSTTVGTDSSCSLRDALLYAANSGAANVYFDTTNEFLASNNSTQNTITLANGTLAIPSNTTIQGATSGSGATLTNLVTVSGNNASGIFSIASGVTSASIANLTIANGTSSNDGGGINNAGTLTVTGSTFSGNSDDGNTGRGGGAIYNSGTLTVTGDTFSGNSANGVSTLSGGGGIYNSGTLTVTNSTFTGDSGNAHYGGGAIFNSGTSTVTGATFSGNSALKGGGIYVGSGTLTLANSIVAGNTASSFYADISGVFTNDGGNQAGTNSSGTSQITVNLAPLGNYGGPTQTMIPLPGSAAICAGTATPSGGLTLPSRDQRGDARTTSYGGTTCVDAGAVETNYSLAFTQQPAGGAAAATIAPAPTVQLDESGAPITLSGISISISAAAGTLSGTTTQSTDTNGQATFGDLSIGTPQSGDTLTASMTLSSLPAETASVASSSFSVTAVDPAISFTVADHTYGDAPFSISASSNSPGAITYSVVSGPASISGSTVTLTGAGTVTLKASQAASGEYAAATQDATFNVALNMATTTLSVTASGSVVTTVASGAIVTLTARVQSGSTAVTAGQVNFCDASAAHCTDIHLLGTSQLTSAGTAVLKLKPGIGKHNYQAVFVGTSSYGRSTSSVTSLSVTGSYATITTIAKSGSAGNYTLTATVAGLVNTTSAPPVPTGTVSFLDTTNSNYVLGTASLGAGTLAQGFAGQVTYTAGSYPHSVAVGDFNGDGIPDLVVANGGYSTVSVFLGKGDGTFNAQTTYTTGNFPYFVAVGDFNGDGIPDLATANGGGNSVSILLGKGDGTFNTQVTYATGSNPFSMTVGDFNGDGIPDLAAANYSGNSVSILLGRGDGTFQSQATYMTGSNPSSVAVGDFNGDGIPDLAVANKTSNTVSVLLGKGDGTFNAQVTYATGSNPLSVAVGDFNGDGILDLAVANEMSNTVGVLLGKGDGTFNAQVTYAAGSLPLSVAVGDFNGDGIADLAVANVGGNTVSVLRGKGDGTFQSQITYGTGSMPYSASVGDFNGDGIADLAVANYNDRSLSVLQGQWTETATASASGISPVGSAGHTVEASYPGNGSFAGSTSSTTSLTAQPVATALTLGATPSSSTYGRQVVLMATLSPYTAQGYTTDGDTVTFYSNGTSLGTGTLSDGVATLDASSLPGGADSLTAGYASDGNFDSSNTTTPVSLEVIRATPIISWTAPSAIVYGTALSSTQLNATANYNGTDVPGTFTYSPVLGTVLSRGTQTLSVTFAPTDTADYNSASASVAVSVGSAVLTVSANDATKIYGTANPAFTGNISGALNGDIFTESFTTAATTSSDAGTYAIVPSAAGADLENYTETIRNGRLTITKAGSVVALTGSAANANANANVAFTATVTSATTGTPTGEVEFLDGSTLLGTVPLNSTGVATYSTTKLAAGTHPITAIYTGDTNFNESTSAQYAQTVTAPGYSLMANPASLTLKAGQTGKVTVTFTPVGGYTGTVNFACTGLPENSSCSFAPSSLTADGSNQHQTSQLTIATEGPNKDTMASNERGGGSIVTASIFWLPGLFFGCFLLWERKKLSVRTSQLLGMLIVVATISGMVGCGFGHPQAPSGSHIITVTATATGSANGSGTGTMHTATFTLTITQ